MEGKSRSTAFATPNWSASSRSGPVNQAGSGRTAAPRPACPTRPTCLARLLRGYQKVSPPVLRPAALVLLVAERLFLPLADDDEASGRNAKVDQIVLDRRGTAVAETEVVLGAAARVAVPFHRDLHAGPALQPVGILLQHRPRFVAHL